MTASDTDRMTLLTAILAQSAARHGRIVSEWPDDAPKEPSNLLWQSADGHVVPLHPIAGGTTWFKMIRADRRGNYAVFYGEEVSGDNYEYSRGDLYVIALI